MSWTIISTEKLRQISLFAHLSEATLEKLAAITYTREYPRGTQVFAEDSLGSSMYMIAKGKVRISKHILGVGEEALAILNEGSYFGEMGLLEEAPRSADAWADKTCTLNVIDRQDLEELMARDALLAVELLRSFVKTLSRRLRETNSKVTFLAVAGKF